MRTPRGAVRDLVVRHAVGFLINFAGVVILARALGPTVWGIYGIAYVAQFITQGLGERGMVGFLIQRPLAPGRRECGTALVVQAAVGSFGAAMLLVVGPLAARTYAEEALVPLFAAVAVSLIAYSFRAVPLGLLERDLNYRRVALIEVADIATFNALAIAGVVAGLGWDALVAGTALRGPVSLVIAWSIVRLPFQLDFSAPIAREILAFAAPYAGGNALNYVNGLAAPLLVATAVGPRAFGVLQLAYSLVAYPQVLNGIVGRVAFPAYSRVAADPKRLVASVSEATSLLVALVGALTMAFALSSLLWMTTVFGPVWHEAAIIMIVIAPALGVGTSLTFVIAALNAAGHVRAVFGISALFSVCYWIVAAVLVPRLGFIGLPVAYAVASATFIAYLAAFRHHVGSLRIRPALLDFLGYTIALGLAVLSPWPVLAALVASMGIIALAARRFILLGSRHWVFRA